MLRRPGGNVTGTTSTPGPELLGKQLQVLRKTLPHATRMAMLLNRADLAFGTELALKSRMPTMNHYREMVEAGDLMAYLVNMSDFIARAAAYVDKILKGAKPADLPVEQPTKFELVINLQTAKALRLTIPPSVLARADEVIR